MGRPFFDGEDEDARIRMLDEYPKYATYAAEKASEFDLETVPWRDVLNFVEYMLRSIAQDTAFIEQETSAGRPIGLRQLVRYGFADIFLYISDGLEHGQWIHKVVAARLARPGATPAARRPAASSP
jgi:hypothetical protein